jgi:hypothetical protein
MQVVKIADEVNIDSLVENRNFENALILGPAVLAPLERVTIAECNFDGTPEALFLEVAEGRSLVGVVGLKNVVFRRCAFRNVALIGTPQAVQEFQRGFNVPPDRGQVAPAMVAPASAAPAPGAPPGAPPAAEPAPR